MVSPASPIASKAPFFFSFFLFLFFFRRSSKQGRTLRLGQVRRPELPVVVHAADGGGCPGLRAGPRPRGAAAGLRLPEALRRRRRSAGGGGGGSTGAGSPSGWLPVFSLFLFGLRAGGGWTQLPPSGCGFLFLFLPVFEEGFPLKVNQFLFFLFSTVFLGGKDPPLKSTYQKRTPILFFPWPLGI